MFSANQHAARRRFPVNILVFLITCAVLAVSDMRVLNAVDPTGSVTAIDRITQIAGTIFLLAVGIHAWRSKLPTSIHVVLLGAMSGALFFTRVYGCELLDPTHISWVLRGDWAASYGGWDMYRHTPWTWPPGATPSLMYPLGTSIVYTDSLPLVALALKPFARWLPDQFQYLGFWFAICCVLQGVFGGLLTRLRTNSIAAVFAGTNLFLFAPVFLQRSNHIALMSQWLLLAAIWLYFRDPPFRSLRAEAWPWWLLAGIAALIAPYLAAMVFAVHFAYWFRRTHVERSRSVLQWTAVSGTAIALTFLLWYLSGGLLLRYSSNTGGVPYGVYSFNLLGLINSDRLSRLVPAITIGKGQYEGFAYLGLGVFFLILIAMFRALILRRLPDWRRHWPLIATAVAAALFATSSVIAIGPYTLFDRPIAGALFATFRSSGRFIWIAYYLIVLGAIWAIAKQRLSQIPAVLLLVAFVLQVWEFGPFHFAFAHLRVGQGWPKPEAELQDPRWDELAADRHHLTLIPPLMCGVQAGSSYLPFLLFAAKHSMTLNTGYVARWDVQAAERYCQRLETTLAEGERSSDDVYVVTDDWMNRFQIGRLQPHCQQLDDLRACVFDRSADLKETR